MIREILDEIKKVNEYEIIDTQNNPMNSVKYDDYDTEVISVKKDGAILLFPNNKKEFVNIDVLLKQDNRIKDIK